MGQWTSRRSSRGDVVDPTNNNAYKYPPKSGTYFGHYFIMGGTRFESSQPDAYLFGENKDLNFLGSKPTPFPYPAPQANEATRTLKSLVNIRKDSLKFVREAEELVVNDTSREPDSMTTPSTESVTGSTRYNIEFTFDTDVKCAITIYYFASEEIVNKIAVYRPRDPAMNSETFHYKRGANQVFCQPTHFINPSLFADEDWVYSAEKETIPIVIHCIVEEEDHVGHAHMTFAVVERSVDGGYVLKAFKQKQIVDGLCYLLQEIYGIENKNTERAKLDEDFDDNGSECVICMSETRDTLILPCRHLCLCNGCADNLRYQANNCPICRSKFRALLQLRAIRKKPTNPPVATAPRGQLTSGDQPTEDLAPSQEGVPPGYEAVALIEALNGPTPPHCALNVHDSTLQSLTPQNREEGEAGDTLSEEAHESNTATPTSRRKQKRDSDKRKSGVDIEELHASPSHSKKYHDTETSAQSHGKKRSDSMKGSGKKRESHEVGDGLEDVDAGGGGDGEMGKSCERKEKSNSGGLSKSPSASSVEYISEVIKDGRSSVISKSRKSADLERNDSGGVQEVVSSQVLHDDDKDDDDNDDGDKSLTVVDSSSSVNPSVSARSSGIQPASSDPLNAVAAPNPRRASAHDDDDDDVDARRSPTESKNKSSRRDFVDAFTVDV